ncbi:MAG TPA: hypothetical protein VN658_03430 [Candidatus Acidoferrales bacterium]|nr:hypothetical protein [Candidatus Acidoferrales bacterium]
MTVKTVGYEDLMTAIVKKQISVIGSERAVLFARKVPQITVSNDGTVVGGNKAALSALCQQYMSVASGVAKMLMKSAVAPLLNGSPLDLPDELR